MWRDLYVLSTKPKVDPKTKDGDEELKQLGLNKQSKGLICHMSAYFELRSMNVSFLLFMLYHFMLSHLHRVVKMHCL
jgi:hypothetical protein